MAAAIQTTGDLSASRSSDREKPFSFVFAISPSNFGMKRKDRIQRMRIMAARIQMRERTAMSMFVAIHEMMASWTTPMMRPAAP